METLVVGAGAVGRWVGSLIPDDVAFMDVDESAAQSAATAANKQKGRSARVVSMDTAESFGMVCIAVPLTQVEQAVIRHAEKAQTAIIDLTGQMEPPLNAMATAAPNRERASYHPLFAPEQGPGRIAVSTAASGPATDRLNTWLKAAGNNIVEIDPGVHDEAMKTIQGQAHAAILAFGLAAADVPPELSTPVFETLDELRTRITSGEARVYADIQEVFGGAQAIANSAETLAEADKDHFETLYQEAGENGGK